MIRYGCHRLDEAALKGRALLPNMLREKMFLEYQSSMVHNQWVSKDHNKTPFIREIY
jgi:hypothetical protein